MSVQLYQVQINQRLDRLYFPLQLDSRLHNNPRSHSHCLVVKLPAFLQKLLRCFDGFVIDTLLLACGVLREVGQAVQALRKQSGSVEQLHESLSELDADARQDAVIIEADVDETFEELLQVELLALVLVLVLLDSLHHDRDQIGLCQDVHSVPAQ